MHSALLGIALALSLAAAVAPAGAADAATEGKTALLGPWLSGKKGVIVDFYPCGSNVCGRIAWLGDPLNDGKPKRDKKNPNPALRDRPLCGIQVIRGLEPQGDGVWDGGEVYDPKHGNSYSLEVKKLSDNRLKLRAYLGIKLLGISEVWTRPDPNHEIGCVSAK